MEMVKSGRGVLFALSACFALVLFMESSGGAAEWTSGALKVNTTVSVLAPAVDPDPNDDYEPRGYEPVSVFDSSGTQTITIDRFDAVKVQATLFIPKGFPLPMQVRVVFGGPSFRSAPRQWTLRSWGEYSTSTYFTAGNDGIFNIGAQVAVRYKELCDTEPCPIVTDSSGNQLLDAVTVGPLY